MPRFVILLHQVASGLSRSDQDHHDWMFDIGDSLATWATPCTQNLDQPFDLQAQRLANHRQAYLDFEGNVSGDRGAVSQIASGSYVEKSNSADELQLSLHFSHPFHGTTAKGCRRATVLLVRSADADDSWLLRYSPDES